ncbi:MAG: hypothetical protein GX577_03060, partial [Leptolinea sp.]|nr:hypothetical protein [Leptolinea sp.]
ELKTPDNYEEDEFFQLWGTKIVNVSPHVNLQYVWGENHRWNLHVIVDEQTKADELRKLWSVIDVAKEQIKQYQGSDSRIFSIEFLRFLDDQNKKEGISYQKLAYDANFDVLLYFLWAIDKRPTDPSHCRIATNYYRNMFEVLGISKIKSESRESEAREYLSQGKLPWGICYGPFAGENVRASLRQYRKDISNGKIIKSPIENKNYFYSIWSGLLRKAYVFKVEEMLKGQKAEDYKKYIKRLQAREIEALRAMVKPVQDLP